MWTFVESGGWFTNTYARRYRVTVTQTWTGLTWSALSFSSAALIELDMFTADPGLNLWQFNDQNGTNNAYVQVGTPATGVDLSPGTYWVTAMAVDEQDRAWDPTTDLNTFTLSGSPVTPFSDVTEEAVVGARRKSGVRVLIYKSSTNEPLAELPFDPSWSFVLSGAGSLSGSLPIWHPLATETILGQRHDDPDREVTVFVDGVADWNGPLTGTSCKLSGDTIEISVREVSWYLLKRTLEHKKDYTGWDLADALDDLLTYATTKTATGTDGMTLGADIKADIPRFTWDVSALVGQTLGTAVFAGTAGHTIQEVFDFLAADPETGFEWRVDYRTSSTRQVPHRTLVFGYPNVGTTMTGQLTQSVLSDYGRDMDNERAATRVTVMYGGGKVVRQSATAVANNVILTETVDDYTDTNDVDMATSRAKDLRRIGKPMIRVPSASIRHGGALSHDFLSVGDVMPFGITWPDILSITADTRRVVEIAKRAQDGALDVDWTFNDRLDDLAV